METRFMAHIYVRHTSLSSTKRTRAENKFAELERALLVSAPREFAGHFLAIFSAFCRHRPRSHSSKRVDKLCVAGRRANQEWPSCPAREPAMTATPLGPIRKLLFFGNAGCCDGAAGFAPCLGRSKA